MPNSSNAGPRAAAEPPSLLSNFSALAGSHVIGLVVPLLTVPYLARVLRPEGWAPVLVAQALASWLVLLLDYGFDLSGTRAIALARARVERIDAVIWNIQYAKLLLVPVAAVILVIASFTLPALQNDSSLALSTLLFIIARGLNPLWYFQGLEQVRTAVSVDTGCKVLGALSVFVWVTGVSDSWRVVALQAGFALISSVVLTLRLCRDVPPTRISARSALEVLQASWTLFAFRASSTLYMQANTLLLAVFSSALVVAGYGGAEKIVRAAINLLEPLTRVLLPRISYLSASDPARAGQLIRQTLLLLGTIGVAFGVAIVAAAPLLVSLLLGPGYENAIPVLRVLALLLPIITVGTVLGTFWALPFGQDRSLLLITASAGVLNVLLLLVLVPRLEAVGMAAAVVVAEAFVAMALGVLYLRWRDALRRAPAATT